MSFTILKLSGFVLDSEEQLAFIPKMVKKLASETSTIIIVHGAGKQVDSACEERSIPIQKIAGRRITSEAIMKLMLELVHGKLNRNIVQKLLENEFSTIGVTSSDAKMMQFVKRPPKLMNGELIDFGFVGDFVSVQPKAIEKLCEFGIPVVSCIGFDPNYGWLNVNADTITKELAKGVQAKNVLMASETAGVKNANGEWMKTISIKEIETGILDGWIKDGMIVKLEQAVELVNQGILVQIGTIEGLVQGYGTFVIA
ncbi:MAG: acetylglutamate kinase [Bacteroidetes bacterium]|nr:acetylglutamate kinase [Bacteroidota bacterium]NCQ10756.1 acetylglutamate kinase [Bacteroidota bacterium]